MEIGAFSWFFLSIATGLFAKNYRGRSGIGWFLFSLILSPFFGFILVFVLKSRKVPGFA